MINVTIPNWNSQGVLPPINPATPTSSDRSPYPVSLTDLVLRFGTSLNRQTILAGFLEFRSALHTAGIVQGFQWIDGSFLENIEMIENRSPGDIDVVTFFHLFDGQTQEGLVRVKPRLFNSVHTRADYHIDAYFVQLNSSAPEPLVGQSAYWCSLWSHRRNGQWKGYLQLNLSSMDDHVARANLDKMTNYGGQP